MSKFEDTIAKLLRDGGVQFKREVSFKGLNGLHRKPLRFDFVIYKNNKICACIEADGIQHFYWTKVFQKTIFDFKRTQEHDRIKNAWCLKNRIPLIRVPYWDKDNLTLEKILTEPSYRVKSKFHTDLLIKRWNQ